MEVIVEVSDVEDVAEEVEDAVVVADEAEDRALRAKNGSCHQVGTSGERFED